MKFTIIEGPTLSNMFGLSDTEAGLNWENMYYHQSVAERHPNLVLTFAYLKDLDDVDSLNISGLDGGKKGEQGKRGVDVTIIITYKTTFPENAQRVTVSLDL